MSARAFSQNVATGDGELALVNGRVYTFDEANRVADSLLIRNEIRCDWPGARWCAQRPELIFGRVPLPPGEGGAKRRVRA